MKKIALLLLLLPAVGCAPGVVLTDEQIPQAKEIEEVMWSQARLTDPAFKLIDAPSYSDADYGSFVAAGKRVQVVVAKMKSSFTKGAGFDALADQIGTRAGELIAASEAKDPKAASTALASIRETCRNCHKLFR